MKKLLAFITCACILFGTFVIGQNSEISNDQKAIVYIVRTHSKGKAVNFKYFVDNQYVGKFKYGKFLKLYIEPGEHVIWAKSENVSFIEANLEAGKTYVVNAVPKMGALLPGYN